jgi:hypothetical protein
VIPAPLSDGIGEAPTPTEVGEAGKTRMQAGGSEVASHPLLYLVVAGDLALRTALIGCWDLTRVTPPLRISIANRKNERPNREGQKK